MTNSRLLTQLKQRFASEILWHFVGHNESDGRRYERFISILKTGLRVGNNAEPFKYVDKRSRRVVTLRGHPVCCLADIPLKDLLIHAERYGHYAIGFHKESAIMHDFNPVLYVNQYSSFFDRFMALRDEIQSSLSADTAMSTKFKELLLLLGSTAKSGDIKANPVDNIQWDQMQCNNFYYEREWRSMRNWLFTKNDIAMLILPDNKIASFVTYRDTNELIIDKTTPVMPFSMIYRL